MNSACANECEHNEDKISKIPPGYKNSASEPYSELFQIFLYSTLL